MPDIPQTSSAEGMVETLLSAMKDLSPDTVTLGGFLSVLGARAYGRIIVIWAAPQIWSLTLSLWSSLL